MRSALNNAEESLPCWERGRLARIACVEVLRGMLRYIKSFFRSLTPTQRQFHALARGFRLDLSRWAFVKGHCDFSAKNGLHFHRNLRREKTERAVDMRTELGSFFGDSPNFGETPNLKSTRIGQHRSAPTDEFVQTAASLDYFKPGPQPKMIGIAENDLRVEIGSLERFETNPLDRAGGAHRHEDGSFNLAAASSQNSATRFFLGC